MHNPLPRRQPRRSLHHKVHFQGTRDQASPPLSTCRHLTGDQAVQSPPTYGLVVHVGIIRFLYCKQAQSHISRGPTMPDSKLFRSRHHNFATVTGKNSLGTNLRGTELHTTIQTHLTEAICALEELNYGMHWNGEPTQLHQEALKHIRAARAAVHVLMLQTPQPEVDNKTLAAGS